MLCMKGVAWLNILEYARKQADAETVAAALAALSPGERAEVNRPVLPISWVTYGLGIRFLLNLAPRLNRDPLTLVRDCAVYSSRKELSGVYRLLTSFASPRFVLQRATAVWRQYYNQGVLTLAEHTAHSALVRLTEAEGLPIHHEIVHLTYMEELVRLCGRRSVHSSHPRCLLRGDDHCAYVLEWD